MVTSNLIFRRGRWIRSNLPFIVTRPSRGGTLSKKTLLRKPFFKTRIYFDMNLSYLSSSSQSSRCNIFWTKVPSSPSVDRRPAKSNGGSPKQSSAPTSRPNSDQGAKVVPPNIELDIHPVNNHQAQMRWNIRSMNMIIDKNCFKRLPSVRSALWR